MKSVHARWLCLLGCLSAGCAKAPFTTSVLEQYGLTANDLGRVQFYTSEPIVLEREATRETRIRDGAELRLHDDTQTEVVEVSERTPCVVLRVEGNYLLLGFSPKDLRAALWFVAQPEADGDRAYDRRFVLAALENGLEDDAQPFSPRFSKGFLISWSGQKYHVVSGRGAYLLYQMSDDERRKVEHSPPGWRLSERAPQRPTLTPLAPPPTAAAPEQQPEPEQEVEVEP
jgi:hypothetical protein